MYLDLLGAEVVYPIWIWLILSEKDNFDDSLQTELARYPYTTKQPALDQQLLSSIPREAIKTIPNSFR